MALLVRPFARSVPAIGPGPGYDVDIGIGAGLGGGAVGAALTTLIVGAILIAVAEGYTEERMASVVEEPVDSFLYGLFALLALIVATVALFLSVIGVVVAIPLVVAAILAWSVGAAIAYLGIAGRLVGHGDGWAKRLLVAALINGGLALTGVGGLVSFVVGAAGFGAVLRNYPD